MANYSQWQYPAKAEPVFVPAVVVTPPEVTAGVASGAAVGVGFSPSDESKKRDIDIALAIGVWLVFRE